MIESLYQSGSFSEDANGADSSSASARALLESMSVIGRVATHRGRRAPGQVENMGRRDGRIEAHEVTAAVPGIARSGKQVVHLVRRARRQGERREIEFDPSALNVAVVEVHDRQDHVGVIKRGL